MKLKNLHLALLAAALVALPAVASAATFGLDRAHTSVGFGVKHMVVSTTQGTFKKFDGTFNFSGNRLSNLKVTIQTASIDTQNAKRDGHLRSGDFLLAKKYPTITFMQTKTVRVRKGRWVSVPGKLTIRGVTRTVALKVKFNGAIKLGKKTKVGFAARLKINRYDYGVKWNKSLGAGRLAVGKIVKIHIRGEGDSK